jgi:hypothetical protein
MNDRADKELLLARLADWDSFLRKHFKERNLNGK